MSSPYRDGLTGATPNASSSSSGLDIDLLPMFAVLWVASLVRVSNVLVLRERFTAEPALALLVVLLLPLLALPTFAASLRRSSSR